MPLNLHKVITTKEPEGQFGFFKLRKLECEFTTPEIQFKGKLFVLKCEKAKLSFYQRLYNFCPTV